jgi:hypothetical protein
MIDAITVSTDSRLWVSRRPLRRTHTHNPCKTSNTSSSTRRPEQQKETFMDEEDWVYAWEEDWVDEDRQLWVITMLSVLVMPFYEGFHLSPILFPNLLEKITKK